MPAITHNAITPPDHFESRNGTIQALAPSSIHRILAKEPSEYQSAITLVKSMCPASRKGKMYQEMVSELKCSTVANPAPISIPV